MRCNRSCAIPPLAPGVNIVRRTAAEMRFACQRNLALEGPEQIHCSRTGEWDAKPPLCVQLQTTPAPGCDVTDFLIAVPDLVVINASDSEVALGAVFEAFCNYEGYILEGRSHVTCKANGMWDFDPKMTCIPSCAIPSVVPGVKVVWWTAAKVRFACQSNLALEGPEQIHCSRTGEWDAKPPVCVQPQKEQTCNVNNFKSRVPPEVVIEENAPEAAAGTVYHAFCKNTDHIFNGQSRVFCNADGTWSFDARMSCIPSCAIPSLAPGVKVVWRTTAGVRFGCQSNLALEGPEQIHCSRTGEWDAKPPVCVQPQKEQTCNVNNFLSRVPPEVVIEENAPEAAAGTVYHAFCKNTDHMFNGHSRVFCNADGTWSFDARMSCVKGCPNFADQDESLIIEGILPTYQLGDSITLSCPGGTELDPPVERITCLGDRWSETKLPHCSDRFPFRF
ncbi:P-selectin [Ixodes scapularis]|uniref:P-selectin n=1 Tax=Ixodes scapularis TaxID=6945 RepID=UPI001A9F1602|nr:P-selectin [Ixodes scapularis]